MLATINTDASFINKYAGYAFWIVCDEGKIQKAGKVKNKVSSSTEAEMMCITNAIHTLKNSKFDKVKKVIINTDCTGAIELIMQTNTTKSIPLNKVVIECRFLMMEFCMKVGASIRDINNVFQFRHVKAHNGTKDNRSFVNNWCDKEAKKYAKIRFKESNKTLVSQGIL